MAFFHFEVRTTSHISVTERIEFDNAISARVGAAKRIGQLLVEHAEQIWTDENWQLDVTNDDGLILYEINVSTIRSAATVSGA